MSVNSSQPCTENTIIYGQTKAEAGIVQYVRRISSWSENTEKIKETEGEKERK